MVFDRNAFLKVVSKSGLSKTELALVYATSRQTIYNQLSGGEPTSHVLIRQWNHVSTGLQRAIDKRVLPFAGLVSKEERKKRIDVIVKHLHANK